MNKKIFLHIGIGKTGTTSIQKMFFESRKKLLKDQTLYPLTGISHYGHHNLAKLGDENISTETLFLYNQLLHEIETSCANKIVISSENFIFMKPNYIKKIAETLNCFDVKVVVYVREQISLFESTYMEWLKAGKPHQNSVETFFSLHKNSFNFMAKIQPWIDAFGIQNISARLFNKKIIGENVCNDILNVMNISKEIVNIENDSNQSISNIFCNLIHIVDQTNITKDDRVKIIDELLILSKTCKLKVSLIDEIIIKETYKKSNNEFAETFLSSTEKKIFLEGH